MSGIVEPGMAGVSQFFGRSVNPIQPGEEAYYNHHIVTGTPILLFSDMPACVKKARCGENKFVKFKLRCETVHCESSVLATE